MLIIIQSIDNTMENKRLQFRGIHVSIPPYRDNCGRLGEWCAAQYHKCVRYYGQVGGTMCIWVPRYFYNVLPILWRRGPSSFVGSRALFKEIETIAAGRWVICTQYCSVPSSLVIGTQVGTGVGGTMCLCADTSWGGTIQYCIQSIVHSSTQVLR